MTSVLVIYQDGFHAAHVESVLAELRRQPVRLRTCRWQGDASPWSMLEPEIGDLMEDVDCAIIAGMPLHVLSRITGLDDSHPLSAIVIYCLAAGQEVVAVTEGVDPRAYALATSPPGWRMTQLLDERMRGLAALGVRLVAKGDLGPAVTRTRRRVVTLKDVRQAARSGEISDDGGEGILTPLAKDWLRDNRPK